jgi:hypothetical protein
MCLIAEACFEKRLTQRRKGTKEKWEGRAVEKNRHRAGNFCKPREFKAMAGTVAWELEFFAAGLRNGNVDNGNNWKLWKSLGFLKEISIGRYVFMALIVFA